MDNLLKYGYQFLIIIIFITVFIGLLASPVIYINIKQNYYFKKLSKKLNLNLDSGKSIIKRNFPKVYGNFKNTPVYIQASVLGEYSFNTHYNTQKFASPIVVIAIKIHNPKIKKFKLIQLKEFDTQFTSNFDTYFDIDIENQEKTDVSLNNSIKQKIVNYAQKHPYFNIELKDGYLMSIANYELTSETNYLNILKQFSMVKYINDEI